MKEFEAQKLVSSIRTLLGTTDLVRGAKKREFSAKAIAGHVGKKIQELLDCCRDANLPMSVLALERARTVLPLSETAIIEALPNVVTRAIVTVEDELSLRVYFALEPDEAASYSNPFAGWERIVDRFGDTTRDIEEMSKCFALGRYTASMFHALHVAEWGAIKLGDYIGVSDPKKGWGPTQKKLKELVEDGHSKLPPNLSGKFDFLEQMNREIQTMVLAWRHKVDHAANHLAIVPNTEFTPDIARHVIDSIKVFMTRLEEEIG
ncbi:MAG: hypothetical protein WBA09_22205 [Candidatus Acidiferrum sp.]